MCRIIFRIAFLSIVATSVANAQEERKSSGGKPVAGNASSPAEGAKTDDPRLKKPLRSWEAKSTQLKTLDVHIKRVDRAPGWGNEEYDGRALLKAPDLAWLDFKKVEVNEKTGQRKLQPHERIVCTGAEVWQYRSDTHQIFIFPLDKRNKQSALEEGPLPFLFNMKAEEAEARYVMHIVKENEKNWVISVIPRLRIDRESFSKAFLQLNRESYLPDRIMLFSPDGKSTKDFVLSKIQPNASVMDDNFKGIPLGKPWSIVRDPGGEGGGTQRGASARQSSAGNRQAPVPSGTPSRRR
ncbi:MAG: hypothetical protein NVSMB9_08710 [Isosphaeraceae bacterium]